MDWVKIVVAILSGVCTCIPLVVKLIGAVQAAVREKNWQKVVTFVLERMKEAEGKFSTGEERKQWVLTCVKASADTFNYEIDMEAVAAMIDAFSDMSKTVNAANNAVVMNV